MVLQAVPEEWTTSRGRARRSASRVRTDARIVKNPNRKICRRKEPVSTAHINDRVLRDKEQQVAARAINPSGNSRTSPGFESVDGSDATCAANIKKDYPQH